MEGYYGLNESVIECKPTAYKGVNGKMKKPLVPGKYVASIQPGRIWAVYILWNIKSFIQILKAK